RAARLVTNRFFTGCVITQSVCEREPESRTYSFMTDECMYTEATALAPAVGPAPVTNVLRYAVASIEAPVTGSMPPAFTTRLTAGTALPRFGVMKPAPVHCAVFDHASRASAL